MTLQRARSPHRGGARVAATLRGIAGAAVALAPPAIALAASLAVPPALAAPAGGSDYIAVTLLSEDSAVTPGRPFTVGVRMKIRKGWHTYWRNPGDAGLPLAIVWTLPDGFTAGPISWPAPERMPSGTLMSYGYEREVLFPVAVTPPASIAADSVVIAGRFDWLECSDVCLSASANLDLRLPVRAPAETAVPSPGPDAALFAASRARMPRTAEGWIIAAEGGPRAISISVRPPAGVEVRGGYFYADQPLVVEYAAPQGFERTAGGARITATPASNDSALPARLTGVLALEGSGGSAPTALAVDVALSAGDPTPAPVPSTRPLGSALVAGTAAAAAAFFVLFLALRRRRKGEPMTRFLTLVCLFAAFLQAPAAQAAPAVGKAAPSISLQDMDGKAVRLSDYKGKFVVLEWVNFDCPFVGKHYGSGNMQALQKKYTERDVVWLTICSSAKGKQGHLTGPEAAERLRERDAAPSRFLLDPKGTAGKAYGAKTTPHMFVVDPKGVLLYDGAIDDKPSTRREDVETAKNYVVAALDAAMAGKPVEKARTQPYGCSVKY
jgi:DsbC/DsbD-like thiol-disulfide interchange protein/peroxiredoxin